MPSSEDENDAVDEGIDRDVEGDDGGGRNIDETDLKNLLTERRKTARNALRAGRETWSMPV